MAARFFHVSSLRLSAAVTVGHPSSVTVDLTHKSYSNGTFRRVFIYHSCTKFLFWSFVFHSLVSDLLNYLPFVEHWPSAHTMSSSHCSIRFALRSAWENFSFFFFLAFLQVYFSTPKCIDPLCLAVFFPASWIMDARMGGVVPRVPWGYLRHFLVEMPRHGTRRLSLVL